MFLHSTNDPTLCHTFLMHYSQRNWSFYIDSQMEYFFSSHTFHACRPNLRCDALWRSFLDAIFSANRTLKLSALDLRSRDCSSCFLLAPCDLRTCVPHDSSRWAPGPCHLTTSLFLHGHESLAGYRRSLWASWCLVASALTFALVPPAMYHLKYAN